jgi:hypothetical protein
MWIFVNALIENPAFDSQTKETLTLKSSQFGSKCELSEDFVKKGALPLNCHSRAHDSCKVWDHRQRAQLGQIQAGPDDEEDGRVQAISVSRPVDSQVVS